MLQLTTIFFLISFSLLSAIYYLSLRLFLFWKLEWLDIPMHIFGGAIVALGVYTLRDLRFVSQCWLTTSVVLGVVLLVAIARELFELHFGLVFDANYYVDTASDIVLGLVGGYIGHIVGKRLHSL